MRRAGLKLCDRGAGSGWTIGAPWAAGDSRVRELAGARELLRPGRATSDHDRVLDVVAQRVLMDIFEPGALAAARRRASVIVSVRAGGRVAAPSAC